ncbi:MAG: hypothetical protein H8E66_18545 [Planctomycetes bacterium]|nr:hypothetical protein [Planctomycetota bacterium]
MFISLAVLATSFCLQAAGQAQTVLTERAITVESNRRDVKATPLYARIKSSIDAVRSIDTHYHLRPFDEISNRADTWPRR